MEERAAKPKNSVGQYTPSNFSERKQSIQHVGLLHFLKVLDSNYVNYVKAFIYAEATRDYKVCFLFKVCMFMQILTQPNLDFKTVVSSNKYLI